MDITLSDIKAARRRISPYIHETDITSVTMPNGTLYVKAENLQKTGSFKVRGATNKILQLSYEQKMRGVLAASAGNHAQGVAIAARNAGIACTIVMPKNAPLSKISATREYGATVVLEGDGYDDAYAHALKIEAQTGAVFIHPFDDYDVIAGQGTIGLEILDEHPTVEQILIPIGGGGLAAGVAFAVKSINPNIRVIGVEPTQAASMHKSLTQGKITTLASALTMADGIAVKTPGIITYALCKQYVDEIVEVSEDEIAAAILYLLEKAKIVSEGAGAAAVAAAISAKITPNLDTVAILSGGNIDVTLISQIIDKGLMQAGRKVVIKVLLGDRPGQLVRLLEIISNTGANIVSIRHDRMHTSAPINYTVVDVVLETRNRDHISEIYEAVGKNHSYTILD